MQTPDPISTTSRPFLASLALLLLTTTASAYERYYGSDGSSGNCSTCRGSFKDNLHDGVHVKGTDPVTTNCNLCHPNSQRDNPLTMWSMGDGLGCTGCHGRDYGENIGADYGGFSTTGKAKNSGRGLRRHHAGVGLTICTTACHTDAEPYPENVMNPGLGNTEHYYFRADVNLGGSSIDSCINEDSANDTDTKGLDNDGDGLYDRNDPDCLADGLRMNIIRDGSGDIILSWPAPGENWALYENPAASSTGWTIMAAPTYRVNGRWEKTVTPAPGDHFYRLEKP